MELNVGDQKFLIGNGVQLVWDNEKQEWKGPNGQYYGNNSKEAWPKYLADRRA